MLAKSNRVCKIPVDEPRYIKNHTNHVVLLSTQSDVSLTLI